MFDKLFNEKKSFAKDNSASAVLIGAVVSLVVILAILMVGLPILDGIQSATALESGDGLYNTSLDVMTVTESAYGIAGVVPTIAIAVPILLVLFGLIYAFGSRRD